MGTMGAEHSHAVRETFNSLRAEIVALFRTLWARPELPGLEVVARGPVFSNRKPQNVEYTAVVFPGPKGNTVFNAATIWWADGLSAPFVFDGALNGAHFLGHVEQALVPTLRPGRPRGARQSQRT